MENYSLWAICVGVLVLLFEAYKEYSTADAVDNLKSNNQPSRKELENVRMTALTTEAENRRGRLIYMLMFVLLYIMILVSPEFISVFIAGGAQPGNVSNGVDVLARSIVNPGEDGGNYASLAEARTLPFWLAIAIVIGATSPTFQAIERKVRAFAYFFAGVPRNIYRVLQSLAELNFDTFGKSEDMPLLHAFREKLDEASVDPIMRGTVRSIESALRCIDLLQAPIIGPQRSAFRQLFTDEAPLARIEDLSARYSRIRARIRDLKIEDTALNELQEDALALVDSMQCLFALYAIRSRKIPEALRDTPTAEIIEKITDSKTSQSLHDISLASLFGAVFSYLAVERVAFLSSDLAAANRSDAVRDVYAGMLIPLLPALVALAFMTILARHLKIDQGSWPKSELGRIPFWDYAKLAFVPTIVASALYGMITCLGAEGVMRHLFSGEIKLMIEVGSQFLLAEYSQLPRVFLMSFCTACGLLFIADQHDQMRWYVTVGMALVVSVFLWMVATGSASLFDIVAPGAGISAADMSIMVTLPFAVFLVLFASAAEVAETTTMKQVFSAAALPFRNRQKNN